jgi:hypothetical protein
LERFAPVTGSRYNAIRKPGDGRSVLSGRYNQFNTNPPERMLLNYVIPALPKSASDKCPS